MHLLEENGGRRWLIAGAVALALVVGGGVMFRFPALPPRVTASTPRSAVQVARPGLADEILRQETELRDLRPLFLPTERNAALPLPKREPSRSVLDDEQPKWSFGETDPQVGRDFPAVVTLAGKPMDKAGSTDALSIEAAEVPLLGFGRRGAEITPIPERGGYLEVVASNNGRRVLAETLPVAARPAGGKAWEPLELLATVDAAGLVSPLVITEGSRVEEVDLHFKEFLGGTYRIGARLPPGYYRVSVAP